MDDPGYSRMIERARALGMGPSALARLLGLSPQQVSNWRRRGVPPQHYVDIAHLLGRSVEWLSGHSYAPDVAEPSPLFALPGQPVSDIHRTVPPTMPWESLVGAELPPVFKVAIPDESLAPDFKRGTLVELTRALSPTPGDGVLVRDRTGQHYLRIYRERLRGQWFAGAINPAFAELDATADGLEVIAVVTATGGRWS